MDQAGNKALKLKVNLKLREAVHAELIRQFAVDTEIDKLSLGRRQQIEKIADNLQTVLLFHVMQGDPIIAPTCVVCPDCGEPVDTRKAQAI